MSGHHGRQALTVSGDVTLLRLQPSARNGDVVTYAAIRTRDVDALRSDAHGAMQVTVVPWDQLPGLKDVSAAELAGKPPNAVAIIGTTEAGQWATWHAPVTPPPVPRDAR